MGLIVLNPKPPNLRPTRGWKRLLLRGDGTWATSKLNYPLIPGWNEDIVLRLPEERRFPAHTHCGKPYPRGFHIALQELYSKTDIFKAERAVELEIDPDSIVAYGYILGRGHDDMERVDAVVARRIWVPPPASVRAVGPGAENLREPQTWAWATSRKVQLRLCWK